MNEKLSITGTLVEIYETQQVSEKFKKREFVIQDNENPDYPQYIKFELAQDKCSLMDLRQEGEFIDVAFNVRGRSYVNPQGVKSYFNSLQCWKLTLLDKPVEEPQAETATFGNTIPPDDMPF